jgi:hypothetical protein
MSFLTHISQTVVWPHGTAICEYSLSIHIKQSDFNVLSSNLSVEFLTIDFSETAQELQRFPAFELVTSTKSYRF